MSTRRESEMPHAIVNGNVLYQSQSFATSAHLEHSVEVLDERLDLMRSAFGTASALIRPSSMPRATISGFFNAWYVDHKAQASCWSNSWMAAISSEPRTLPRRQRSNCESSPSNANRASAS